MHKARYNILTMPTFFICLHELIGPRGMPHRQALLRPSDTPARLPMAPPVARNLQALHLSPSDRCERHLAPRAASAAALAMAGSSARDGRNVELLNVN